MNLPKRLLQLVHRALGGASKGKGSGAAVDEPPTHSRTDLAAADSLQLSHEDHKDARGRGAKDAAVVHGATGSSGAPVAPYADLVTPRSGCRVKATEKRAVSLPQLKRIYEVARRLCVEEKWTSTDPKREGQPLSPDDITLYDLMKHLGNKATEAEKVSLMEVVARAEQPPEWFVSHWWGECVKDFIACIEGHLRDRQLPAATTYYWICAYGNNQWELADAIPDAITETAFFKALSLPSVKGVVAIVDPRGVMFTRKWCVYEMFIALVSFSHLLFDAYTVREDDGKVVGLCDGLAAVDEVPRVEGGTFASFKAERESGFPEALVDAALAFDGSIAEASKEKDAETIDKEVHDKLGGYTALNHTVAASFSASRRNALMRKGDLMQLQPLLDRVKRSRLRKFNLVADREASRRPNAGDMARDVGSSIPDSVEEIRLEGAHPSVLDGVCERVARGGVRVLELTIVDLSGARMGAFVKALRAGGTSLHTLNLIACGITASEARQLATASRALKGLRELDLGSNSLGDEGAIALAPFLAVMGSMTHLLFGNNKIGDAGAKALAPSLAHMRKLTILGFEDNIIGDEGAIALAPSLAFMGSMTVLDFARNNIGDAGAIALAPSLAVMGSMTVLGLENNRIGDAGAIALAPSLAVMGSMTTLEFVGHNFGDEGGSAIAAVLPLLSKLNYLSINKELNKTNKDTEHFSSNVEQRIRTAFKGETLWL